MSHVLIEQDPHGKQTPVPVLPGGIALDVPVVVVVDEGTFSAGEIFAAALQDHERGPVVGARTFGTGTILMTLPAGAGPPVAVSAFGCTVVSGGFAPLAASSSALVSSARTSRRAKFCNRRVQHASASRSSPRRASSAPGRSRRQAARADIAGRTRNICRGGKPTGRNIADIRVAVVPGRRPAALLAVSAAFAAPHTPR